MAAPKALHHDPTQAVASQRRMVELEPALVVSTHGYPVRGVERWSEGVRAAAQ